MEIQIVNTKNLNAEGYLKKLSARLPDEDLQKIFSYRKIDDSFRCAVGKILIHTLAVQKLKNFTSRNQTRNRR